ncbi:hypothetical protein HUU62_08775 [Rhodoferax sp. 4810]|uniref:Uncharacterized protein n=1 Tax=Thiospirillum jenense TaxID=1653858 RepID=A0A839H768_9GAMM|nr:hypothetical protein [Thiospirillum jenense]MBB1074503.1 hypothetical protein [Rhodoferax jenense]MBB1125513.1 hypothetical protein [Thiospirillum jenense]
MTLSPTTINGEYYYRVADVRIDFNLSDIQLNSWLDMVIKSGQIILNKDDALVTYDGMLSYLTLYCQNA